MWIFNKEKIKKKILETGAGRVIYELRQYRLSLPMHEHAGCDAPRRNGKYLYKYYKNIAK